jgi:hypothetical protein
MIMLNDFGGGDDGRRDDDTAGGRISSDREDSGLAALEGLSLDELAVVAAKEIGESRQLQVEAVGLARRSTATLYRAGRALWCARKRFRGKGKRSWTKWQKVNSIPITSAWQAIRLYEMAEGEKAVAGLTRSQALHKYGITRPKRDRMKEATNVTGEPTGADRPAVSTLDVQGIAQESDAQSGDPSSPDELAMEESEDEEEPQVTSSTPPATEILIYIVRRLEILEQDSRGDDLGDEAHDLIDRAIAALRRLRGDAAPSIGAA